MKRFFMTICSLLFLQTAFSQTTVDYIIQDISIVPMNEETVLQNKNLVIKSGKIIAITDARSEEYDSEKTIDGTGKYLLPTFGDAHVHLPREGNMTFEKYLTLNFINGVTKLRSMRGAWKDFQTRKKYDSLSDYSPWPKLYISPPPFYRSYDFTEEQLSQYVEATKKYGFDFIKIISIKDETLFQKLNQLCKENGIYIAAHFPKNLSDSIIFNSQINCFEHLGGLIGIEENLLKKRMNIIKENGIFIDPTLSWNVIGSGQYNVEYMTNQRGMEFIAPETLQEWTAGTKKYREEMGKTAFEAEVATYAQEIQERLAVINQLNEMGVKLLISPDASSKWVVPGFGLLEEMKLYKKAGLSNYAILRAATVNFADYFDGNYGTIEVGKDADFMFLSSNPMENLETLENIEGIFLNGQYLDKMALEEMAEGILPEQ